jgi:hypothetical protein
MMEKDLIDYSKSQLIRITEGLTLFAKYPNVLCGAEHDVLCVSYRGTVSDEDKLVLGKLGWFWSEEYDSWAIFV